MGKKFLFSKMLALLLACMMIFTGCQSGADSQTNEAGEVDRYNEIVDMKAIEGKMAVYFLDLEVSEDATDKSGDCTLLISPDGKVMLIDAGHTECGGAITDFLKELGITKIDYLVATHPHIDHIGGMPKVINSFEIGTHYRTEVEYTTQTYYNYVDAVEGAAIPVEYVHEGDSFMFGEKVKVEVFNPEEEIVYPDNFPEGSTQFLNNSSLLLKFTYGESTFLFGGDLYLSQEKDLVDEYGTLLDVDVAKANHHGDDTSNCSAWVKAVLPQIVVGMGDDIGAMDIYERYVKREATYYHTFCDGYVRIIADDADNFEVTSQYDSWMREE